MTTAIEAAAMRVLLINPYYPISETPSPPLGLAYLGAAIEAAGGTAEILDLVVAPYRRGELAEIVDRLNPHLIGATAVTMTVNHATAVIREAKSVAPDTPTVMGGPHVTFRAEETLADVPELDAVVLGEGEQTLVELARAAGAGNSWEPIAGLVYRSGPATVRTAERPPIADLNRLPLPARHLVPLGRYRALGMPLSMTTSRGCPFGCIFCVGRKMVGARVRYRDPVSVVDELEVLAGLGFHQINLADDLFTANMSHCKGVCDEILRRGLRVGWTSFARVDTVNEEMLARMKSAGCHTVSFGVESGSPQMLTRIKKGITREQVVAAAEMCRRVGISAQASFILGLPGETPETLQQSVDFGNELKALGVAHGFHLLAPFPGTDVRDNIDRYDLKITSTDWGDYHANRAIVETSTVDRRMLDDVVIGFEKRFDEWLGMIGRQHKNGEIGEQEAWPLIRLVHTVRIWDLMRHRILEQRGSWEVPQSAASPEKALAQLADRLAPGSGHSSEELLQTLTFCHDSGDLRCRTEGNQVVWEWVDFL